MLKLLSLLLILTGCRAGVRHVNPAAQLRLQPMAETYRELVQEQADEYGFIGSDRCDSLLFTGLAGTGGLDVDILAARSSDGQWFRRPGKDCLELGESRSTISRDMIWGLLWYAWAHKDLALLEDFYTYGKDRNWRIGDSDGTLEGASRTLMTTNIIGTTARMIEKLGGKGGSFQYVPLVISGNSHGYRAHLEMLALSLNDRLGHRPPNYAHAMKRYADRNPNNLIFQAMAGRYEIALSLAAAYPQDRLPTNQDWCEEWPPQRDGISLPCDEGKTHSGGEILFLYQLLGS